MTESLHSFQELQHTGGGVTAAQALPPSRRRHLAVMLRDQAMSLSPFVPLCDLQVTTSYIDYNPNSRHPAVRFCGWRGRVDEVGRVLFGNVPAEHSEENLQVLRACGAQPHSVFSLAGAGVVDVEDRVRDLSERGWLVSTGVQNVQMPDGSETQVSVYGSTGGNLWFKNSMIGHRYCLYCMSEQRPAEIERLRAEGYAEADITAYMGSWTPYKGQEICTPGASGSCPTCGRRSGYIEQSNPLGLEFYGGTESPAVQHVMRRGPLASLAEAQREILLNHDQVMPLVLPREAYYERVHGVPGDPLDADGVIELILEYAKGWTPFACRSPVSGQVEAIVPPATDGAPLEIHVGGRRVLFDGYWLPEVREGAPVVVGDTLALPMPRPQITTVDELRGLDGQVKQHLWVHVSEAAWLLLEQEQEVYDRTREYRVSGQVRVLYPHGMLKAAHRGRPYVDCRGCRLGELYLVDSGVMTQGLSGLWEVHVDALSGPTYNFWTSTYRDRLFASCEEEKPPPSAPKPKLREVAQAAMKLRETPVVLGVDLGEAVVVAGTETHEQHHSRTTGESPPKPVVAGDTGEGDRPNPATPGDPADGREGQGPAGVADPEGYPHAPALQQGDLAEAGAREGACDP